MPRPRNAKPKFLAYGGEHQKSRAGRGARPITHNYSMHFVLRSSRARGEWSFRRPRNHARVQAILGRFARKYAVELRSYAIHLNHLHLHVKLPSRKAYVRFIRALTSAIAMAVTGMSRWSKLRVKFWDRRPFSRPILDERAELRVRDYIRINQLETMGYERAAARFELAREKAGFS
jgi:REP element-mobilizing transposase RayT